MTPPSDPAGRPGPLLRGQGERTSDRRVFAVAFALSAVLHLAAILLYPTLADPDSGAVVAPSVAGEARPAEGTEIVRIAEVPDEEEDEVERPAEPEPRTVAVPTQTEEAGEGGGEADDPGEETGLSAADRIRATAPDPRLVMPLPEDVVALSPEQIAQLQLVWALENLNDSAAAAAARARAATDWTWTDSDGKRWGVSPGKLHLGDVTLPLPSFGAPYDPNAWKGSVAADIERTAGSAAARESGDERAKAIRERKDRERREAADTTGGGGR